MKSNQVTGHPHRTDATDTDIEALFESLDDPDCRDILTAVGETALTAKELMEVCDLPRSTTYCKIDRLVESGLLDEQTRLCPDGHHTNEYRRACDDVVIDLGDGNLSAETVTADDRSRESVALAD